MSLASHSKFGFTLAELLISLAILGVIATFTIPKILLAQSNSQYNASAKEAAAMLAGAFQTYSLTNTVTANTRVNELTPYMNFVNIDSSTTIDLYQTAATVNCGAADEVCLRLHNGGMFRYKSNQTFSGTNTTNALYVSFDPDGRVTDGTTNGPGKAVTLFLYFNGRLSSWSGVTAGTVNSETSFSAQPASDPPWFQW